MSEAEKKIKNSLEKASNILVTVGKNPTADELTAALALTLAIDKMGKHASAIFSGKVPHFMSFLHPEKVFENSTDSFRDFVISLDKGKADQLRYKVEGDLVKIFITPYHTSLDSEDLQFSHGELNIDMVIAIGVKKREDLDEAILLSRDKILHSATVAAIDLERPAKFATLNWAKIDSSGYSEAIAQLITNLGEDLFSEQIATTLLTGIVLATNQFSNEKTRPSTMQVASKLLDKGADQQLIIAEMRQSQAEIDAPIEIARDLPERVSLREVEQRRVITPKERPTARTTEVQNQQPLKTDDQIASDSSVKVSSLSGDSDFSAEIDLNQADQTGSKKEEIQKEIIADEPVVKAEEVLPEEANETSSGEELTLRSDLENYMPPALDFSTENNPPLLPPMEQTNFIPAPAEHLPIAENHQNQVHDSKKAKNRRFKIKNLAKKTHELTKNTKKIKTVDSGDRQVQNPIKERPLSPPPQVDVDRVDPGRFIIPS